MRLKHSPLLSLLSVFVLSACSSMNKHVGNYSFQMGKDKGVHINVTVDLLDKNFGDGSKGKLFAMSLDMKTKEYVTHHPGDKIEVYCDMVLYAQWSEKENVSKKTAEPEQNQESSSSETYTVSFYSNGGNGEMEAVNVPSDSLYSLPKCEFEAPEGKYFAGWTVYEAGKTPADESSIDIDSILKIAYSIFSDDGKSIQGYYSIGDAIDPDTNRLIFGLQLEKDSIKKYIEEEGLDLPDIPDISPDLIEKILYSTINSKSLNLIIPVSTDDLMLQLYWYGYDIYIDESKLHVDKVTPHGVGEHPSEKEISKINQNGEYKAHHEKDFRDYHTLTVGLLKN